MDTCGQVDGEAAVGVEPVEVELSLGDAACRRWRGGGVGVVGQRAERDDRGDAVGVGALRPRWLDGPGVGKAGDRDRDIVAGSEMIVPAIGSPDGPTVVTVVWTTGGSVKPAV